MRELISHEGDFAISFGLEDEANESTNWSTTHDIDDDDQLSFERNLEEIRVGK